MQPNFAKLDLRVFRSNLAEKRNRFVQDRLVK